jgi:hypothetical protein
MLTCWWSISHSDKEVRDMEAKIKFFESSVLKKIKERVKKISVKDNAPEYRWQFDKVWVATNGNKEKRYKVKYHSVAIHDGVSRAQLTKAGIPRSLTINLSIFDYTTCSDELSPSSLARVRRGPFWWLPL